MRSLRLLPLAMLVGAGSALAQSPTYGVGRTPSAEEIRAWDISISPTGEELPPGRGTPEEGAQVYMQKACFGCHGMEGVGQPAPRLIKREAEPGADAVDSGAGGDPVGAKAGEKASDLVKTPEAPADDVGAEEEPAGAMAVSPEEQAAAPPVPAAVPQIPNPAPSQNWL